MKKFKKILAISLAVTLIFSMAGCGDKKSDNDGQKGEKQILKVGTEPTFPPFDTIDDNQNITGFDMDLMKAIAKDQGFKVEFVHLEFAGLIPSLQAGNIDIAAAGISINKKRAKQVDFSDAYWDAGLVLAVKSDNNKVKSVNDLTKDMKVSAQAGTAGAAKAEKLKKEGKIGDVTLLNGVDVAVMQVISGYADAVINDKPVTEAYIKKQKGKIKIVGKTMDAESYGIAVKKGNDELLKKINKGLANLKKNGEFDKIVKKWFK